MPRSEISVKMTKAQIFWGLLILALTTPQIVLADSSNVTGHISCAGSSVGISLDIDGVIDSATVEDVSKLFVELHQQVTKVASGFKCDDSAARQNPPDLSAYGDHFGINSLGGSVSAAMAVGRMLRRENAWIMVNGVCFSACVLILAGAVDRHIGKSGQVGIHRPYFGTTPDKPLRADEIKDAYLRMLQEMRAYLREMNVPQRLADDMLAVEPENNHILTEAELKSYRLAGVDPGEQQRRAIQKEAADVQEANQLGLDRREYTRRKSLGNSFCDASVSDENGVTACKESILKHGNF